VSEIGGSLLTRRPGLRFTGFVAFAVRMGSLLSGLAFSLIVARRLSEEDFGSWAYVGRLVSYFAATASFINFWAARDAGRGGRPLKTALFGSALMVTVSTIAYLGIVGFSAGAIGRESWVVLLGLMQLPVLHLVNTVEGVSLGYKPVVAAYGFAVFEVAKVFLAFMAVHILGLGLIGVFASVTLAQLIQLSFIVYLQRELLDKISLQDLIKWLKGFPVQFIGIVNGFVYGLDIFLGGALYGSALPLAYWQAALTVALVINFYSNLAAGLYPALLSGGGVRDVEKIFRFAMMFGVPMLFGSIFLGKDILRLLRPVYAEAAPTLYILALSYWIGGLTSIFGSIVGGREDVDKRVDASFRDYLRSWLFRYNIATLLLGIAYVTAFSIVTYVARTGSLEPVDTAYAWSYVHLGLSTASLAMTYLFSKRKLVFSVPWKSIIRYLLATALMLGLMYPLYLYVPTSNTAVVQIARVASMLTIGIATYFGSVILLDKEGREMVKILVTRFVG
jgi:O-antigen/teichoic acid export membrane protein